MARCNLGYGNLKMEFVSSDHRHEVGLRDISYVTMLLHWPRSSLGTGSFIERRTPSVDVHLQCATCDMR
jgi:hypothetical protein